MRPKDRILAAWNLKPTDELPVALFGGGPWALNYFGKSFNKLAGDGAALAEVILAAAAELPSPIIYVGSGFNNFLAAAFDGKVKYGVAGAPDLEEPVIKDAKDIESIEPRLLETDPVIENLHKAAAIVSRKIGDRFLIAATSWAPFTLAAQLYGVERLMRALRTDPKTAEKIVELAGRMIAQFYRPLVDSNIIDLVSLADPTASGDLISKDQFRRFALPPLTALVRGWRSRGARVLLHMCGRTADRWQLILKTKIDCFSVDHKVDILVARDFFSGKMSVAGNVDPVKVLQQGTVETVRWATETASSGQIEPGYILMPGCDIAPGTPVENLKAFLGVKEVMSYGHSGFSTKASIRR